MATVGSELVETRRAARRAQPAFSVLGVMCGLDGEAKLYQLSDDPKLDAYQYAAYVAGVLAKPHRMVCRADGGFEVAAADLCTLVWMPHALGEESKR